MTPLKKTLDRQNRTEKWLADILHSSTINVGATEISIDLSNFTKGMYILRLNNGQKSIASTKLLK